MKIRCLQGSLTEVIEEGYKMVSNFDENKKPLILFNMYRSAECIHDQTIDQANELLHLEYENCVFSSCHFENYDLSEIKFIDCTFNSCNLSLANIANTAFQNVKFYDCKMLGLHFELVNTFGLSLSFNGCRLDHSSFYKLKLKNTVFKNSQMQETNFAEADLTAATFENCDLMHAVFDRTLLEKADLRTATNFSINPETNRIKKAKFSITGLPGLLQKYQIEIEG